MGSLVKRTPSCIESAILTGPYCIALMALLLLVFAGLIFPAAVTTPNLLAWTGWSGAALPVAGFAAATGLLIAFAVRRRPLGLRTFLGFLGILYLLRLAWVLVLQPELVSDFKLYWLFAGELADDGLSSPLESFFHVRAFPFFYPLTLLFGKARIVFQVANIVVLAIASLYVYRYSDRRFGKATAQAAVLFCNLAPETFAAAGIATNDIAGLLFISLIGLLVLLIDKLGSAEAHHTRLLGASISLAVVIMVLDIQRIPAAAVLLSLWIAVPASLLLQGSPGFFRNPDSLTQVGRRMVFIALVPTVLALAGIPFVHAFIGTPTDHELAANRALAFDHSFSPGTWEYARKVTSPAFADVPLHKINEIADHLALSDFADDPAHRITNMGLRAKTLFSFGSTAWFYLPNHRGQAVYRRYVASAASYALLVCALLIILPVGFVTAAAPRDARSIEGVVTDWPIIFVSLFCLALLLIGEVQSRYLFPFYFLASPWLIGVPAKLAQGLRPFVPIKALAVIGRNLLLTFMAVGLGYGAWLVAGEAVDRTYDFEDGRIVNLDRALERRSPGTALTEEVARWAERDGSKSPVTAFGPYEIWIGPAAEGEGIGGMTFNICDLDPDTVYRADLFLERRDFPGGESQKTVVCRLEHGEQRKDVNLAPDKKVREGSLECLRPDSTGCLAIDLSVAVSGSSDGKSGVDAACRIVFLRLTPEG